MSLENIRRKLEADKKAKPYTRTTVIIGPDGKLQRVTERVSLAELQEDMEAEGGYEVNPEDPNYNGE